MISQRGEVRPAALKDITRLLELEHICWPAGSRVSRATIEARVRRGAGQFVVEADGNVQGVVYSQRIKTADQLSGMRFDNVDALHGGADPIAHVLSLNVDPACLGSAYGDSLLEYLLTWYEEIGVATVVGVTRCGDFVKHPGQRLVEYIAARNSRGRCVDPVLRMHQSHGAVVRHLVPGYRPADTDNDGHGVLVEYTLAERRERVRLLERASPAPAVAAGPAEVLDLIADLLDDETRAEVAGRLADTPLFELGLDSVTLSELQERVETRFGVTLEPLFFFEYDTGAKIVSQLARVLDAAPAVAEARGRDACGDVAIIGMACRLPGGVEAPDALWELLAEGRCAIGSLPDGRWRWPEGAGPAVHPGIDRGGFVADADRFEAALFRVSPHEARRMDPQQRWMLELAWACLEDAGYSARAVAGAPIGVWIGASGSDYQRVLDSERLPVHAQSGLATSMAIIANRVSYFFDLCGPSVQVDTACSSSLVAVHSAVRALRAGDCTAALVGGVNVLAHPAGSLAYHQAGMLSPDGLCKTFDESADGYVRAEGGVMLLLKPLATALADGDPVHAVIRGTATNHGGLGGGLTVPNARLQSALIAAALADAGAEPAEVGYVEAHGTGTALGDPIEVQGLTMAFAGSATPCGLGSLKTNLGHLEAAAGIAGLVKSVLALRHGTLPASLHFRTLNPRIALDDSQFFVVDSPRPWEGPRLAGISSFGSGGSNAHVIVGPAPTVPDRAARTGLAPMVVLSAATEDQLRRQAAALRAYVADRPEIDLADLAYTLQVGREPLRERVAFVPDHLTGLRALLDDAIAGRDNPAILRGTARVSAPAPAVVGGDHRPLLRAWVAGADPDWAALHGGDRPRRIHLPTHAFGGKRFWLTRETEGGSPRQHTFTGDEPFLRDHTVRGARLLPAVVQLELARAAVADALPNERSPVRLTDVVWPQPVVVTGDPLTLYIGLSEDGDGRIRFEIRSRTDNQDVVHARGTGMRHPSGQAAPLDIQGLRARTTGAYLEHADCYAALRAAGLDYGPTHRALREVRLGDGELLAGLASGSETGLLDGALQSVYGPEIAGPTGWTAALPFALDSFEVLAELPTSAHLWARRVSGTAWDLDLADPDGAVVARLRGYTPRGGTAPAADVTLHRPVWRPRPPAGERVDLAAHAVLACGLDDRLADLRALAPHIAFLDPPGESTLAARADALLRAVRELLGSRPAGPALVQVLAADTEPAAEALSGLLWSAHVEDPAVLGQVIVVPSAATARELADVLDEESRSPGDRWIRRAAQSRLVRDWEPVSDAPAEPVRWRPGGVYLITGGAGGLGLILAEEVARRAPGATLVLTGRSPLTRNTQARLDTLGAAAEYHRVDVADPVAVSDLVADLRRRLGGVHGVIHNAGVLRDGFLLTKSTDDLIAVLRPKVDGSRALDAALGTEDLDFFVLASSVMGTIGNVGQADYAVANAFLDGFARHRADLVRRGERAGRTVAIGWPLWRDGGMRVDPATDAALRARTGLAPLSTTDGVAAFHRALSAGEPQVFVAVGDQDAILTHLRAPGRRPTSPTAGRQQTPMTVQTLAFLTRELATSTGLSAAEIDEHQVLGDYGMDSILATELTARLENTFGALPKTLFFEYPTLVELTGYFTGHHGATLETLFDEPAEPAAPVAVAEPGELRPRPRSTALDIAIIGLSGRYPGARDVREYWANLRDGRDCVVEVPADRWDWRAHYAEGGGGPHHSKWGGFIDEVDRFDPLFFAISPHEADHLDPQERLFLEHAWAALEDAGYTRADLASPDGAAGRVGVYAGAMWNQYQLLFAGQGNTSAVGSIFASIANRVSFVFNAHGPSMTVDTMCSGSLTAIELACRDLAGGRTRLAFAGGVNVTVHPNKYLSLSAGGFLAGQGHCESFGRGGDGYVPGEGVGVVLLKPLADAERDGDHVYGVIKGAGISHGGRTNGFTVPNPRAQGSAIRDALAEAGVDPRAVGYVEAHGTGTTLGDPIEIAGLGQAFGPAEPGRRCYLGSAKSNIGHCESAAGIAGLTKVLLQLRSGRIAPSLHSATLNPNIDFAATPFEVNQVLRDWERPVLDGVAQPRIAGVSSFGAGGSNAHLVVAEHTGTRRPSPVAGPVVITLSARDEDRLRAYAAALLRFVADEPDTNLVELAFTLQVGREAMDERLGVVTGSLDGLAHALRGYLDGAEREGLHRGNAKRDKATLAVLPADEPAEPVERLIEGGSAERLVELWVRGAAVDWRRLHPTPPGRISAPTYPFARERHWAPATRPAQARGETRFLDQAWEPAPLRSAGIESTRLVILHDQQTLVLANALADLADTATLVRAESGAAERHRHVLETCTAWVDLTGLSEPGVTGAALELVRAVVSAGIRRGVRLLFATQGLEAHGSHPVTLTGASRVGLYRMLHSEYRLVHSRHVDLDPAERRHRVLAATLHRELGGGDEVAVCHRDGSRFTAVLRDLPPGEPTGGPNIRGVLLVTGGTRGLGLLCARHLVERHGVRKLVLTGRDALPARQAWADPHPPPVRAKIRAVEDLEARGVEVRVLAVRLDRADDVRTALRDVEADLGPVAAVVHAAGLVDTRNPAFVRKSIADILEVVDPKIAGTENLLRCLDLAALDFVLLFSSVAAVVPTLGAGQGDYAMGNAFLDHAARAAGGPVVSVRWPSWRDTGFGEVTTRAYTDTGLLSLGDAEGLALLDDILTNRRSPVVMPVLVDPDRFDPEVLMRSRLDGSTPDPIPASAPVPARLPPTGLAAFLAEAFEAELKLRPGQLDETTSYADYGADSILLAQVLQRIRHGLDLPLDPVVLLEHPTLAELTAWLAETFPAEIARRFAAEPATEPATGHASEQATAPAARPQPEPVSVERAVTRPARTDRFAVIGMACRFPGAPDLDAYWDLLEHGRTAITEVPAGRWGVRTGLYAGLVDAPDRPFDADRFLLHAEDVRAMDPQALVLLEECLNAVHHAGYRPDELSGSATGVYIGARGRPRPDAEQMAGTRNPIMAVGQNYLAANVAQFFDWQGPAMVVDTACSSSLVALRLAADALAAGSVDLAVVAGVSLLTGPGDHELFRDRGLLGADGRFHIFDRRAAGVVLGEGAGVVLLKQLSAAERDGDTVYAVVEGIAVNNDGRTAGPATPNPRAQRQVMHAALGQAGCAPEQVRHLDVNGSGSEATDVLELKAIEAVYRADPSLPLYLGSMKPNIGHPLCAEGVAAFIKVALMVHHQRLVPFLSAEEPMAHYSPEAANLAFPRAARDEPLPYAAVSSFADGGTNAHVILGEHAADTAGYVDQSRRTPLTPPRPPAARPRPSDGPLVWLHRVDPGHPVVANHRVHGRPLLPGLAWIDLLYLWFAEAGLGFETLELHDLTLHRPLDATTDAGREIRVEARPITAGTWRVEATDPGRPDAPPYVTAEMRRVAPVSFTERVPVAAMGRTGGRDLESVYRVCRKQELVHTGPMKVGGTAHTGPDAVWLTVEGPEAGDEHLFHPALIDGSAVAATVVAGLPADDSRLFLPLFYKTFRASAPLRGACRTRVRRDTVRLGSDLLTFTLEFFTADGHKIAELVDFRSTPVRDPGQIDPARRHRPDLTALVTSVVAAQLDVPASTIGPTSGYYELGLDSVRLLQVVQDLEAALGVPLSPTLLFEHTTVAALAEHLAEVGAAAPEPAAPTPRQASAEVRVPPASDDIAIIGMAGRYPGAEDLAEFWANLRVGRDCVTEVPTDRWPDDRLDGLRSPSGRPMSRLGGFIADADRFDAAFFGIPAQEAARLDPQERLFLQTCWAALEDAGHTPDTVADGPRRAVGVYVGVMHKDYALLQAESAPDVPLALNPATIANRVSHVCDFHGPSMAVDTACASSLSAVHLAVEAIRRGECDTALAGGVNLSLHPAKYRTYGLLDLHAGTTRPHAFGAGGDGYVSAEGCGAVLLKPLHRAIADGDAVYAVVKGSAVNHAGRTPGIRVPSVPAQAALVADCLDRAGIDPRTIGYLEAHGTGTELGDLMEVQALERAFRARTADTGFCALGSVKSGIGHAESAAGVSALTSAALQLHHRTLVPLPTAAAANPHLDFTDSPFFLQTRLRDWTTDGTAARRAGVSAFGATGTYAHVVLEEAPPGPATAVVTAVPGGVLVPLSAKDPERLRAVAGGLRRFLAERDAVDLPSLAYTLCTGRVALAERLVLLVSDVEGLVAALGAVERGARQADCWSGRAGPEAADPLLDEDDLRRDLVRRWAARGSLGKIAELWVRGHDVDWAELTAGPVRRLHLPTYPFTRERHWVGEAAPAGQRPVAAAVDPRPSTSDPMDGLRQRVRGLVAARLGRRAAEVSITAGLLDLGMNSLDMVGLARDVAATVDPGFLPSTLFEHDTVSALVAYLADRRGTDVSGPPAPTEPPGALAVLERLVSGALDLDDAIALLD